VRPASRRNCLSKALALFICACAVPSTGAQAAELVLDGLVAWVTVVPEARSDFAVEVQPGRGSLPPVTVTQDGGRAVLTNGVEVGACAQANGSLQVGLRGGGRAEMREAPRVIVHAPRTLRVSGTNSGLIGTIGPSADLDIRQVGCAFWDVADVAGMLQVEMSGGASLTAGAVGAALLRASAGGAITTGPVADLVAEASSGGSVRVASALGAVEASASAGGWIEIEGGQATTLRANASGGGRIEHDGRIAALSASASSGGRVEVSQTDDVISRSVSGGGQVIVGN